MPTVRREHRRPSTPHGRRSRRHRMMNDTNRLTLSSRRLLAGVLPLAGLLAMWPAVADSVPAGEAPDFAKQIRPILAQNCFKCHGPDEKSRKAGLRLDVPEAAYKGAIVPGQPDQSELIRRI